MNTKIFLDSGDPLETKECLDLLGGLDGQTTNPSLLAKNPAVIKYINENGSFNEETLQQFYKDIVTQIANEIPDGLISVEVHAEQDTTADEMVGQAKDIAFWAPKVYVKLPTNLAGVEAAHLLTQSGFRVNMTLIFSQDQAAAVYESTPEAASGELYVSPFVGRLDDTGVSGISLVSAIQKIYAKGDGHVHILMASVRDVETFIWGIENQVDAITAPASVLRRWAALGKPEELNAAQRETLETRGEVMVDKEIDINEPVHTFELTHELTSTGLAQFADDWNNLLGN